MNGDDSTPVSGATPPPRRISDVADQSLYAIVVNAETDGRGERVIAPFTSTDRARDHAVNDDIRRYTILPFELSYSRKNNQ